MAHTSPARRPRRVVLGPELTLDCVEQGDRTALPLVLLPGMSDSWSSFSPLLAELPGDLHVLAVSQRGHGASSRPGSGYRPFDYARDVVALLDALALGRAVLVGHSSGSLTARLVASDHPDRVAGLVLLASPLTLRGHPAAAELAAAPELAGDAVPEQFVRAFVRSTVGPSVPARFLDAMVSQSAAVPAHVWRDTFRGLLDHDGTNGLRQLLTPTLLVWGDTDEIATRADQDALLDGVGTSRLLAYEGVGHSPHWEQPARLGADITAFVRGLSS